MSDEAEVKPATENQLAAPEGEATAAMPEAAVSAETKPVEPTEQTPKPEKTFTQAEVEAMIGKRLDRAERKLRRELQQPQQAKQPAPVLEQSNAKPVPDNFKTTEDYIEAVAAWKAQEIVSTTLAGNERKTNEQRAQEYAQSVEREYQNREEAVRIAIPDFDDVVYGDDSVWVSNHPGVAALAHAVKHSDKGPELAHYLGKNREDFARISRLHPTRQAVELGKLEAKLPTVAASAQTTTSAPAPIKPLGGGKTSQPVLSTDDPKAAEKLSPSEWIALREKERRARYATQGQR